MHWAASAAAGVLAACTGSNESTCPPAQPAGTHGALNSTLGEVEAQVVLGDVALPAHSGSEAALPAGVETVGRISPPVRD